MKRKLYALFILIGALWVFVLGYLYFFVYYTGILTINANVEEYRVELFSPGTAQKWIHECSDRICEIYDVAPFDYNISIIKPEYEIKMISLNVRPRGKETLVLQLEKQVRLDSVETEKIPETAKETIQRIRDEKLYYAKFDLDTSRTIRLKEQESELLLQYVVNDQVRDISRFQQIASEKIDVHGIYSSDNVYLRVGEDNYIFDTDYLRIYKIPEIRNLWYIKFDPQNWKYILVTDNGSFLYSLWDTNLEYQYLFRDYVSMDEFIIWVVFADEKQKKKNFNIQEKGNIIVKYVQNDKTRKVIYTTNKNIEEIYQANNIIYINSGESIFELKNFD